MRISEGVEWATHACLLLDWHGDNKPLSTARLAKVFEVSSSYLNKQLQALVKAGILDSLPGSRGGFRLARTLDVITMMDVVVAIEGRDFAFQCTEIRRNGPGRELPDDTFVKPCAVTTAMRSAELEFRKALSSQTLRQVSDSALSQTPDIASPDSPLRSWLTQTV